MSGMVYTCEFPKDSVNKAVTRCEDLLCIKQKTLGAVRAQAVMLEGISVKDKAIREGWSAAQETCTKAIDAIQIAVKEYTNEHEQNSILLRVAEKLDPLGENGGSKHLQNCRRLIQNKDTALNDLVMDFWKRKCSEKIQQRMRNNTTEAQQMQNRMQQAAKDISRCNVEFESAVDQISTSASVASRHAVTIDWVAGRKGNNTRDIPEALNKVLMRKPEDADNVYYEMFKKAWTALQCDPAPGDTDDIVTIPSSRSWFDEVVKSINRAAQATANSSPNHHCEFRFGHKDNRVILKDDELKLKIELGGSSKQQTLTVQVCPV